MVAKKHKSESTHHKHGTTKKKKAPAKSESEDHTDHETDDTDDGDESTWAAIKGAITDAAKFVKATLNGGLSLISTWLVVLMIVIGIAWIVVMARGGFMKYAPVIARHSKGWDVLLNGVVDTFVLLVDGFVMVVHVIASAIRVFGGHTSIDTGSMRHYKHLPHYTATELRRALLNYTHTCANVTSASALLQLSTNLAVGDALCPVLRVTYPLGVTGTVFRNMTQWASPPSHPTSGNCVRVPGGPGLECVILGAGFLAFDILFPILFLTIVVGISGCKDFVSLVVKAVIVLPILIITVWLPALWHKGVVPVEKALSGAIGRVRRGT